MQIAARACPNPFAQRQKIAPELIIYFGLLAFKGYVHDLYTRLVPEPIVQRIIGYHQLLGVGMNKMPAACAHRVYQLTKALPCKLGILEMPLYAALKLILRKFQKQLFKLVPMLKQHIVMYVLYRRHAVKDRSTRLRACDKQTVLPFGQIHMPYLPVIEYGGKIHIQLRQSFLPERKRLLAVARPAGI